MSAHRGGCSSRSGSAGGSYGYGASGNGSRPGSSREAEYMSPFAGGHSGGPAAAGGAGGPSAGASTSSSTNGSPANPYASLQAAPSNGPVPAQQPPFPNPRRSSESVRPYGSVEPAAGGVGGGFAIGSTTARSGAGASTDSMPPPSRYWRKALQSQAGAMPPTSASTSTSASGAGAGSSHPPASPQEANRASVFIKLNRLRQQVQELSRERGGIGTASASNPATSSSSSNTDTVSVQSELSLIRMQSAKLVTGQQKMLAEDKAEKERVRAVVQTFEPLLRGPQIDVDTLRNFRLGRQKWLDMYAGRDSEGGGGGARRSIYDLLPEGEPIPEPPEHPNLDGIVFHGLRGSSFKAIGMSVMISEHSQVLQDLAAERALREEAGNRAQAGGYGSGQANYYAAGGPAGPGPGSSHQQRQQQQQPQQGYGQNAFGFGPPQQQQQPQPQSGVQDPRTMYGPYGPGSNLPPIPAPAYGPGYGYHPGGNGGGGYR
ncbi:hypothetical protein A4X09_0g6372 [Tilletia walkeri]|uniref:Uncharacterized protein n=1 Tax=Tilletia walkeri TaxID=117179 RepID=A0A8X7T2F4_9BASI|nr:hypothetical protein A4X09_0g6372 [Tilletia walkeri]